MDAPCGVDKGDPGPGQDETIFAVTENEGPDISSSQQERVEDRAPTSAQELPGSSVKSNAREIAIQANDYDIERNSSHLPSRKRYIPLKFSDYRIFAGEEDKDEAEEDDASFEPEKTVAKPKVQKIPSGRGRGRPRKNPQPLKDPAQEPSSEGVEADGADTKNQIVKVPSGFKCCVCGRIFSLRGNAKAHLITHTEERPFPCQFEGCDKRLRTKESLRRHQLSHMGIKMFECSECKKKFSCNASLQEHMARHTGAKPLSCDICGRHFRQIAVLKRHMTTHSSDKPFACSVCGRRFAMKIYVQSHMKTHTGERPFSCDICNKAFAHASDLNRHKIIHSGKKPYECSVCSMRYSDPSSRRRHEREHQTKLLCPVCNQQFSRSSLLRIHLVREHSAEPDALSYEVQVVRKPDQESWPDGSKEAKLVRVVQNVPGQALVVHSADGRAESSVQEATRASSTVQLLVEGQNVTQASSDKPSEIAVCAEDDLSQLEPGYIYKIVGNDPENQIFELQLEEGTPSFPLHELATKVLAGVQIGEDTVTLIQQDDSFTVVQTPHQQHAPAVSGGEHASAADAEHTALQEAVHTSLANTEHTSLPNAEHTGLPLHTAHTSLPNAEHTGLPLHTAHTSLPNAEHASLPLHTVHTSLTNTEPTGLPLHTVHTSLPNAEGTSLPSTAHSVLPVAESPVELSDLASSVSSRQPQGSLHESGSDCLLGVANDLQQHAPVVSMLDRASATLKQEMKEENFAAASSEDVVLREDDTVLHVSGEGGHFLAVAPNPSPSLSDSPYVFQPDLNSQEYYNWLSAFAEECKVLTMPLEKSKFEKISNIHKTLVDFMALPSGVTSDKNNFKVLLTIMKEMSNVISKHLSYMYQNLC
ncbi:uncharacterized protein LOC101861524 [Aplysia californica]|uniref:Uncharacterized protein LOC101861524 n=1 Tax=Aplysia californica TaxID=6500 RepID=A0ABM0JWN7_APLCA|nr:uncharacterized protein LOC101861524 [Aplysia californica]